MPCSYKARAARAIAGDGSLKFSRLARATASMLTEIRARAQGGG